MTWMMYLHHNHDTNTIFVYVLIHSDITWVHVYNVLTLSDKIKCWINEENSCSQGCTGRCLLNEPRRRNMLNWLSLSWGASAFLQVLHSSVQINHVTDNFFYVLFSTVGLDRTACHRGKRKKSQLASISLYISTFFGQSALNPCNQIELSRASTRHRAITYSVQQATPTWLLFCHALLEIFIFLCLYLEDS